VPATPYLIVFDRIGSPAEGYLTTTQYARNIPFVIRRVFWTQATPPETMRGQHANKATEEVLIAIAGTIRVKTETGTAVAEFDLSDPATGLYLPAMCWTELRFSEDAIALCLSSTDFDEADYIHSYPYFKKLATHLAL